MKITVECYQEVPNELNYSEVEERNRYIYNVATDFEFSRLLEFSLLELKDEEIVLVLFYDKSRDIKWAFRHPENIDEEIKQLIRSKLTGK